MDWALIIYTAMITSDKLSRGGKLVRSFIDAFLVLNIDFGIDAIAIRLGKDFMLKSQYFEFLLI